MIFVFFTRVSIVLVKQDIKGALRGGAGIRRTTPDAAALAALCNRLNKQG